MTHNTYTPIKNRVNIHTALDKNVKARLKALSDRTQVPQCVILNDAVAKALTASAPRKRSR